MILTVTISLAVLVLINFLLLIFSCNKTTITETKKSKLSTPSKENIAKIPKHTKLAS